MEIHPETGCEQIIHEAAAPGNYDPLKTQAA